MRFKLYEIWNGSEHEIFGNMAEAIKAAKLALNETYVDSVDIDKIITVDIDKTAFIQIINNAGGSYVSERTTVKTLSKKLAVG
jgi:hypothetical protein